MKKPKPRCVACNSTRIVDEIMRYEDYAGCGLEFIGIRRGKAECQDCGQIQLFAEKVYE